MVVDPWLPAGQALPDGSTCRAVVSGGLDWQVYSTQEGGHALVAKKSLVARWEDAHLLDGVALAALYFGEEELQVLRGGPDHALVQLGQAKPPENFSEAMAFAVALRETRHRDPASPLQDAIYVERISRLLPTWTVSQPAADDIVLGRWLSGGVRVSATAGRRLELLIGWMTAPQIKAVAAAAGLQVLAAHATPVPVGPSRDGAVADDGATARSTPSASGKGLFRLPGRIALESFFQEHVIDVVEHEDRYRPLGIEFPSPIALHGPPGSGKTYAIERLVDHLGWPCFSIDSSTIGSPYIHETGRKIAKAFDDAIRASPSVLIIDEMESFLAERQGSESTSLHHIEEVAEFLRRIPEAMKNHVLLVGMTNRIEMIDKAVLRRGRFDHVIEVGMPTAEEVHTLVKSLLAGMPQEPVLRIDHLVQSLAGRPMSDAAFVIREAARLAARKGRSALDDESLTTALASLPARPKPDDGAAPIGFRKP